MASEQQVNEVKRRHSRALLSRPGVSGVGVEKDGPNNYVLAIHVNGADPSVEKELPKELDGAPVRFVRSGPFRKQ